MVGMVLLSWTRSMEVKKMGDHAVGKVRDPEKVDTLLKEV